MTLFCLSFKMPGIKPWSTTLTNKPNTQATECYLYMYMKPFTESILQNSELSFLNGQNSSSYISSSKKWHPQIMLWALLLAVCFELCFELCLCFLLHMHSAMLSDMPWAMLWSHTLIITWLKVGAICFWPHAFSLIYMI